MATAFETFNAGALSSLKKRLQQTSSWVLCAQETGITEDKIPDVSQWCDSRGWRLFPTPALPGRNGKGTSCGAAVLVRKELGARFLDGYTSASLVKHRAAAALVEIPGWPPICFVSMYLFTGGLSEASLEILSAVGERLPSTMLKVIGADWNADAQAIVQTGFGHRTGLSLAVPAGKTCYMPDSISKIDYFAVSPQIRQVMVSTAVVLEHAPKPHMPVVMSLRGDAISVRHLVYRQHAKLPTVAPFGPQPRPQSWHSAAILAEAAAQHSQVMSVASAHRML